MIASFFFGVIIGVAIEEKLASMVLKDFLPALATLVASFLGATYAFELNNNKDAEKLRQENISSGNRAIFTIIRQLNKLVLIQRQIIAPHRDKDSAFVEMPPMEGLATDTISLDLESLTFLLDSRYADLLGEISVAQAKYSSAIDAVKQRSRIHIEEAQPRLEKASTQINSLRDAQEILGPRVFETLRQSTNQAIGFVDSTIPYLDDVANRLRVALQELFPKSRIISFTIPA